MENEERTTVIAVTSLAGRCVCGGVRQWWFVKGEREAKRERKKKEHDWLWKFSKSAHGVVQLSKRVSARRKNEKERKNNPTGGCVQEKGRRRKSNNNNKKLTCVCVFLSLSLSFFPSYQRTENNESFGAEWKSVVNIYMFSFFFWFFFGSSVWVLPTK